MHELSIALSIIEGVQEEVAKQGGGQVCAVHLRLGPLSGVFREALLFSYRLACEGTPLAGSRLVIEDVPLRIQCSWCNAECAPVSLQSLRCEHCGRPASEMLQGTELEVCALELQT